MDGFPMCLMNLASKKLAIDCHGSAPGECTDTRAKVIEDYL